METRYGLDLGIGGSRVLPYDCRYEGYNGIKPLLRVDRYPLFKHKREDQEVVVTYFDQLQAEEKVWWPRDEYVLSSLTPEAYIKNFLKYAGIRTIQSLDVRLYGIDAMMNQFSKPYQPMSWEEVMEIMPTDSSPGYPLNLKYKDKKEFYNAHIDDLKNLSVRLQNGEHYEFIQTIALKEELRTKEKVAAKDTRTFIVASAEHHALFSRYIKPSTKWMYDNFLTCDSIIGMSPFWGNWGQLLKKHSVWDELGVPCTFNGDIKQQDSTWSAEDMQDQFIADVLTMEVPNDQKEKCVRELKVLYVGCSFCVCIDPKGTLVFKETGLISGSANTSGGNTKDVWKNINKTFYMAQKDAGMGWSHQTCKENFKKMTRLSVCGDDFLLTIHPDIHKWFNADVVASNLRKLGKQLKDHVPQISHRLLFARDCTMLSHGFREMYSSVSGKVVVPVPQSTKLLNSLEHSATSQSPSILLAKCFNFMVLSIGHDEMYQEFRKFADYLIAEFDSLYGNEPLWLEAKAIDRSQDTILSMYSNFFYEAGAVTDIDLISQLWLEIIGYDD